MYAGLALFLREETDLLVALCAACLCALDIPAVEMIMLSYLLAGYGGYDDYNGYNDGYGFGSDRFGRGKLSLIGIVTNLQYI